MRELGSLQVGAGVVSVIQMPGDAFQHTTQQAGDFKLSATMADGSPLPGWVSFDSATGTFTLRPRAADGGSFHAWDGSAIPW